MLWRLDYRKVTVGLMRKFERGFAALRRTENLLSDEVDKPRGFPTGNAQR